MVKRFIAALSLALLASTSISQNVIAAESAPAEAPATPAAAKQSPPAPQAPRPVNLPKPQTYKLPNGLTVVTLEDHRVPFVTYQLGMRAGDSLSPKDMPGLAAIVADMLNEGTAKRSSKELATGIESIGGGLKASADPDFTVISGSALSEYIPEFLDMASDLVLHPSFPEDELKLEKTNLLQELTLKHAQPDFLADERFHKALFGSNPYSVVAPSKEAVEKLTRDHLVKFHSQYYVPNGSTFIVVGDFQSDKMKQLIASKFGDWKSGDIAQASIDPAPQQSGRKIYLVDRPGSVQSSVKIGNIGIKKSDPDYFQAIVANQILGGSSNSRLFLNIREKKGYTYGAYSSFAPRKNPGEFSAGASVRTPVTGPSIKEFLYEIDRIRTSDVTPDELTSAKNYLVGSFQLGLETQGGVAQRLLEMNMYDLPANYLETYTNKVIAITPEDIRRVASKHIDSDNLVITVVGDAKKIESDLKDYAPVNVYDMDGKLVREEKISEEKKPASEVSELEKSPKS